MSFDIYGVDTIFNDSVPGIQDRHFRLTTYHNWAPDLVATWDVELDTNAYGVDIFGLVSRS